MLERSGRDGWRQRRGIALLAVAAAAAVAAAPALRCRFVGGDDLRLLLKHPLVSRPCWANALQLLTRPHYDLYQPLPMLAYMAEYRLYGPAPLGYHVDRLILHTANALLAWWLVWQLTRRLSASTLTGLAFAVHPLAVEAVASVAKLTIGLSTALVLACMIAYLRWRQRGGARRYGLSLLTGLLALLCKPIVTLPLGLWLLEAYRARFDRRRLSWRHLAGGLPLLIAAVAAGWLNLHITSRAGLTGQARQELAGPIAARAALVDGWALVRYVWPARLAPWYPPPAAVGWTDPAVIASLVAVAALIILAAAVRRRAAPVSLGIGLFLIYLLPYQSSVIARNLLTADRFMYLPIVGLHLAVVAAGLAVVAAIVARRPSAAGRPRAVAIVFAAAVGAVWLALAWRTSGYYYDGISRGRRLVQLWPHHPAARAALARPLLLAGRYRQALVALTDAPADRQLLILEARAHRGLGQIEPAKKALRSALLIDPADIKALLELDRILAEQDQADQAVDIWRQAVQAAPAEPSLRSWYAWSLAAAGRAREARAQLGALPPRHRRGMLAVLTSGYLELLAGRDQQAANVFAEAISRFDGSLGARAALSRAIIALSRLGQARPDRPGLYWIAAALLHLQGKHRQAAMLLERLGQRFASSPWAHRPLPRGDQADSAAGT